MEKYDCTPKVSDTSYKNCGTSDDMKNGKKSLSNVANSQAIANKRYSIDNYCSNWLSKSTTHNEPNIIVHNNVSEKIETSTLGVAAAVTVANQTNGHEQQQMRILEANKLLHRRSLSENIIPFPPHTTPSDKARCHLINRRNSQLNTSSGTVQKNKIEKFLCNKL